MNRIYHADCLDILKSLDDNSVDAIITDPPYGYLKHKLDCPFDAQLMFSECFRVLKDTGFLLFFGRGVPFAKWNVICDDLGFVFKEELIWYKTESSNPMGRLLRIHESANLFGKKEGKINKIYIDAETHSNFVKIESLKRKYSFLTEGIHKIKSYEDFILWGDYVVENKIKHNIAGVPQKKQRGTFQAFQAYQKGVVCKSVFVANREHRNFQHPTQKPVKLFKQLVELTTKEGDLVIDPFAGSGTTALACLELGRNYICIEKDKEYFEVIENRITKWHEDNRQTKLDYTTEKE
jgi:site-specific DNA-methyltransferase (adenine-specific)